MTNQPLIDFILNEIKQGATKESITRDLLGAGWDNVDVQEGFAAAGIPNTVPIPMPTPKIEVQQPTVSNVTSVSAPSFSSLDAYAQPGANSGFNSGAYAGQTVNNTQPIKTKHTFRNFVLFAGVFVVVVIAGGMYAVQTKMLNIPAVTNIVKNVTNVFNTQKTQTVATVPVTEQPPITETPTVASVTPPTEPPPEILPTAEIQPLCTDVVCKTYFDVWKKEQMFQNNITNEYINGHFIPVTTQVNKLSSGQYFSITYDIKIGWAMLRTTDSFIIKTKSGDKTYPALNIRRGIYLSADEVRSVVDTLAFSGSFTWFTPADSLYYKTRQSATDAIQKAYPQNNFSFATNAYLKKVEAGTKPKQNTVYSGTDSSTCATTNKQFSVVADLTNGSITTENSACAYY